MLEVQRQNDHKIEYLPIESTLQNSSSLLVITFLDFYSKLSKTKGRSLKSTSREMSLICLPDYFSVKTLTMVVFRSYFIQKQNVKLKNVIIKLKIHLQRIVFDLIARFLFCENVDNCGF